jgi:hypothetical protein
MNTPTYVLILLIASGAAAAQAPSHPSVPVFVELFTSEGCSSCPPADAWLRQVDASQPIPGAEIIVLSEHVDYWDHDGWKDPYSSSTLTERQSLYAREFGLSSPYTPQVIVDGQTELHLNNPQQTIDVFQKSAEASMIPITISRVSVDGGSPALFRAHIEIAGQAEKVAADVYGAIVLDHAESQVQRGENGGKHLTHTAVVQEMKKIGRLEKQRNVLLDFQTKLPSGVDPRNLRLVVFLQQSGQGRVLGAAMSRPQS